MTGMNLAYEYAPLQAGEIRLLYANLQGENVTWSLQPARLSNDDAVTSTAFDALSYTWGELTQTFPFVCNGRELPIHKSLRDALPYLARRQSPRPIWIDALCINQDDNAEKMVQIRLMHRVYRQATEVWVWLGCGTEHTQEAISLLPRIVQVSEELSAQNYYWDHTRPTPESLGLPEMSSPIWNAVFDLLCNNWFSRLWIIQEAALARKLVFLCGSHIIDATVLEKAQSDGHQLEKMRDANSKKLETKRIIDSLGVFSIRDLTKQLEIEMEENLAASVPSHLVRVIFHTAKTKLCANPRDRVYGVLGFLGEKRSSELGIDESLSLVELYSRFFQYIFNNADPKRKYWWHLLNTATFLDKMGGLPSWCPDPHQQPNSRKSTEALISIGQTPSANYMVSKEPPFVRQGRRQSDLVVRGTIFDSVNQVFPQIPSPFAYPRTNGGPLRALLDIGEWEKSIADAVLGPNVGSLPEHLPDTLDGTHGQENLDTYWRTLIGNVTKTRHETLSYEQFYCFQTGLTQFSALIHRLLETHTWQDFDTLVLDGPDNDILGFIDPDAPANIFMASVWLYLEHRCLFRTVGGRFGYGPRNITDGDVLCVFDGGQTSAHVLRPAATAVPEEYLLVGEAYVHGMMNGEIESLSIEKQEITLV